MSEMTGPSPASIAAAEERLARQAPGYLEQVRREASKLAVADPDADDTRAALDAVDHFAEIETDVSTSSRFPLARLVKVAVKRLVGWYLGYFARQLNTFGQAVANLADILVERDEARQDEITELRAEVGRLERRLEQLEQAGRSPA